MATEDISVEHRASAETAYFDVENRVLCLPVWEDMDDSLYDMLVGHEVSHALHTPAQGWQDFVGEGPASRIRHMFVNCVEDARIERKIKAKFPGIRRDFASAYQNLSDRDLFKIAGKDISDLPLIDRLNLEFKLGILDITDVPFTKNERQYVTRMAETETFEEVIELSRELYELQREEDKQKQQEQEQQEDAAGVPQSGDGEDDDEGQGSSAGSSGEGDEDSDDAGSSAGGLGDDETTEEGQGSSGSQDGESGEDSGQSMEDDTDDGESADSTEGENAASELSYDDYENNVDCAGSTQNSFERGIQELRDEESGEYSYHTLPTANLNEIIVDYKQIEELWIQVAENDNWNGEQSTKLRADHRDSLRTFLNSAKPTVNQMVQHFMMKQAADADKKTQIAKTGVLDTVSMINYRWSEDIFMKNEVHADAKNHGIVMFVDWSGSMSSILKDTVEQLLILVEFCRKVGIPYEVHAFSSNMHRPANLKRYSDEYDKWNKDHSKPQQWNVTDESDVTPHEFQLYNFLSSRMSKRDHQTALFNLWMLVDGARYYGGQVPDCLGLGCTPLNEAIVAALQIVPAFQRENGIQIVNTVFLTDGEGHGLGLSGNYYGGGKSFLRDKKTRKVYEVGRQGRGNETSVLLNLLRDRTGSNLVGIRLHDAKNLKHLRWSHWEDDMGYEAACKQYKTENFVTVDSAYDEYFIVKGDLKVEFDALDDLDGDASYTRIKNAFIKGGTRKKSSRVIATRMVEIFAA